MSNIKITEHSTLEEWQEFARSDDCLKSMVPSDLRVLIAQALQYQEDVLDLEEEVEYLNHEISYRDD